MSIMKLVGNSGWGSLTLWGVIEVVVVYYLAESLGHDGNERTQPS